MILIDLIKELQNSNIKTYWKIEQRYSFKEYVSPIRDLVDCIREELLKNNLNFEDDICRYVVDQEDQRKSLILFFLEDKVLLFHGERYSMIYPSIEIKVSELELDNSYLILNYGRILSTKVLENDE